MKNKLAILTIPIFFIIPWVGYLFSLAKPKAISAALVYIAFAAFFGYAISFNNSSADSYRYAIAFIAFNKDLNLSDIIQAYTSGALKDIYTTSLFYLTSNISNNPKVLFAVAGTVYGIFSYLNLRIYVIERGNKTDIYTLTLTLLFITFCSISNINGFKFWTGAMIAFYSTYHLIFTKNKFKALWLITTPLIHYSFILFIPVILALSLIVSLTKFNFKNTSLFLYIFIFSFIISWYLDTNSFDLSFLSQSSIVPGGAVDRISYVNSEEVGSVVDERVGNSTFLTVNTYFENAIRVYIFILVLYLTRLLDKLPGVYSYVYPMYIFVLMYYSFSFIAMSFPSGSRFLILAHMFLIILVSQFYKYAKNTMFKRLILLSIPVFSFKIIFLNIIIPILTLSPSFWYGGIIGVLLEEFTFIN